MACRPRDGEAAGAALNPIPCLTSKCGSASPAAMIKVPARTTRSANRAPDSLTFNGPTQRGGARKNSRTVPTAVRPRTMPLRRAIGSDVEYSPIGAADGWVYGRCEAPRDVATRSFRSLRVEPIGPALPRRMLVSRRSSSHIAAAYAAGTPRASGAPCWGWSFFFFFFSARSFFLGPCGGGSGGPFRDEASVSRASRRTRRRAWSRPSSSRSSH